MRSGLRALRRAVLAVPATFLAWAYAFTSSLLLRPWPRIKVRHQGRAFRFWCKSLCRIFGIRVASHGAPPRPPFFLVANHLSYVDILVLGTELPCVFVAKAEIDDWPVFGALCRSVNTIYVDRRTKRSLPAVIASIETTLAAGQGVVIFPEGTSGAGHEVLPFRSSLLELPAKMGYPVHQATLTYAVPPGAPPPHLSVTWWGEMPLAPHLSAFLRLAWIEARLEFGAGAIADADRKLLADRLRAAVSSRFRPLVPSAEVDRLMALKASDPSALPAMLRHGGAGAEPRGERR
jgi:1-acyl-sn-glycerol-3-phosphate acyltransferase